MLRLITNKDLILCCQRLAVMSYLEFSTLSIQMQVTEAKSSNKA